MAISSQPQDPAKNEEDLKNGPLLQELGIDFKMLGRKILASLPFTKVPEDVAYYPEMIFGFVVIGFAFIVGTLQGTNMASFIPLMFGLMIFGSIFFLVMLSLLLQDSHSISFYDMLSAICYSLFPILVTWVIAGFFKLTFNQLVVICIPAAVDAAYILQKFLGALVNMDNVRALVVAPALIYSAFWLLLGRGLAK